ncbi:MAG: TIGR02444 family protein [Rhizobiales bacterium]|nr:TIGR02444 family protein [Hyphomicrobiales bacterium]
MTASQPLDTPLWAFALAVYGSDGVADDCLDLQERLGLDVNILLFAAFLGTVEGVGLEVSDIAAASAEVAHWQAEIVRPLRHVRRTLKPMRAEGLRAQVKAAELEAEKIEMAMLWQWSRAELAGRQRADDVLAANLRTVLEFYGANQAEAALPRLLAAATAYKP